METEGAIVTCCVVKPPGDQFQDVALPPFSVSVTLWPEQMVADGLAAMPANGVVTVNEAVLLNTCKPQFAVMPTK